MISERELKQKAKLFCKNLGYDLTCFSLLRYFSDDKYKIVYFERGTEDTEKFFSKLHISQYSKRDMLICKHSNTYYVLISKRQTEERVKLCLMNAAAHMELEHECINGVVGNSVTMMHEASEFIVHALRVKKPKFQLKFKSSVQKAALATGLGAFLAGFSLSAALLNRKRNKERSKNDGTYKA